MSLRNKQKNLWIGIAIAFLVSMISSLVLPLSTPAQDRVFMDLGVEFLGEHILEKQEFANTPVGGLSGITYDRDRDRFYAISDDRSELAPARFYTLKLNFNQSNQANKSSKSKPQLKSVKLESIKVEGVTFLKNENGVTYPKGEIDPEGIALRTRKSLQGDRTSVFVSSEGVTSRGIPAFVNEFDLKTGAWIQSLPIPARYLPEPDQGIQDNLGFEALTIAANGSGDPLRVFTATESALVQDKEILTRTQGVKNRFLHFLVGAGKPSVVAEHLYTLEPDPSKSSNGLVELIAIGHGGQFLSLERTFSLGILGAKLFQINTASATDTSSILSLKGELPNVVPIKKKLLLDLSTLGLRLDNLEGMTLGTRLADGSQSLILVSDDNFSNFQVTQFLAFRLKGL